MGLPQKTEEQLVSTKDTIRGVYLDSKQAYGNCFAYDFVKVTDNSRTVKLKENLSNQLYLGVNSYSHGLPNETNMIINCKNCVNNPNHTGKKKQQLKKYLKK